MRQRRGFLKTHVNIIGLHAFSCILALKINHVEEHPTVTVNSEWALIRQKAKTTLDPIIEKTLINLIFSLNLNPFSPLKIIDATKARNNYSK